MTQRVTRSGALLLLLLTVALGAEERLGRAQDATSPAAATPAIVRAVLGGGEPVAAPGQVLQLVRYTIAPGTTLPVHRHPGMQVAWLESGTLRYTVLTGAVPIARAGPGLGTPGPPETLTAGQTTTFRPGDSWVEAEGVIHFAQNAGTEPVVILVASLLAAGQPPSILVAATPTG